MEDKYKKCNFCGEKIKAEAVKCRYCGEFLQEAKASLPTKSSPKKDSVFSWEGKIGRSSYIGYSFITNIIISAGIYWSLYSPSVDYLNLLLGLPTLLFGLFIQLNGTVKRLNDLNEPRWISIGIFLPLFTWVISLFLIFKPGDIYRDSLSSS